MGRVGKPAPDSVEQQALLAMIAQMGASRAINCPLAALKGWMADYLADCEPVVQRVLWTSAELGIHREVQEAAERRPMAPAAYNRSIHRLMDEAGMQEAFAHRVVRAWIAGFCGAAPSPSDPPPSPSPASHRRLVVTLSLSLALVAAAAVVLVLRSRPRAPDAPPVAPSARPLVVVEATPASPPPAPPTETECAGLLKQLKALQSTDYGAQLPLLERVAPCGTLHTLRLGYALYRVGNLDRAETVLAQLKDTPKQGTRATAFTYLGHCASARGEYDEAIDRYERALCIQSDHKLARPAVDLLRTARDPGPPLVAALATVLAGRPVGTALASFSPAERRLIQNAAFARHGRPFFEPTLDAFFYGRLRPSGLAPRGPDANFNLSSLDTVDWSNAGRVDPDPHATPDEPGAPGR
jgi:hypothetical protein